MANPLALNNYSFLNQINTTPKHAVIIRRVEPAIKQIPALHLMTTSQAGVPVIFSAFNAGDKKANIVKQKAAKISDLPQYSFTALECCSALFGNLPPANHNTTAPNAADSIASPTIEFTSGAPPHLQHSQVRQEQQEIRL